MIHAYSSLYIDGAQDKLADLFDYAVYDCDYSLSLVWESFKDSSIAHRFEVGDPSIVAGRSGIELAMELLGVENEYHPRFDKTPEYWTGWALAYYQWYRNIKFVDITVPIDTICSLYTPFHEMDILQFCDEMDRLLGLNNNVSNLKRIRNNMGITQSELSLLTGIPLRTIQQYEQKQKDINGARGEYLILLSKALHCDPASLLE